MYNPDGSEANIRQTILQDGSGSRIDLNRDWGAGKFVAAESEAFYEYWTMVDPAFAIDIHHQGLKSERGTGDEVTLSLGISLAPGGPTLPGIEGGAYDVLTRQMQVHVYDELSKYGYINMDRYQVGGGHRDRHQGRRRLGDDARIRLQGPQPRGPQQPGDLLRDERQLERQQPRPEGRAASRSSRTCSRMQELLLGMATGEVQQEDAGALGRDPARSRHGLPDRRRRDPRIF